MGHNMYSYMVYSRGGGELPIDRRKRTSLMWVCKERRERWSLTVHYSPDAMDTGC